MLARAARPLVAAWLALGLFILAARPFAVELDGQYRGALVVIRPFMRTYNEVVLSLQLVVLLLAMIAAARQGARIAIVLLAGALAGVAAFAAAPLWVGDGPFAPGSPPLALYRALGFLPLLLRDLGLAATSLPFVSMRMAPLVTSLALADAAIIILHWSATPIVVLASPHPSVIDWVGLLPLAALAMIALAGIRRCVRQRG